MRFNCHVHLVSFAIVTAIWCIAQNYYMNMWYWIFNSESLTYDIESGILDKVDMQLRLWAIKNGLQMAHRWWYIFTYESSVHSLLINGDINGQYCTHWNRWKCSGERERVNECGGRGNDLSWLERMNESGVELLVGVGMNGPCEQRRLSRRKCELTEHHAQIVHRWTVQTT